MNALVRVGLWLASLFVAVLLFCLLASLIFGGAESILPILRVTMTFALPVGCLYLPFVIVLKKAEHRSLILLSGTLIGPVWIVLWGLFLQLKGNNTRTIWYGDPLIGVGGIACVLFALIVGFLTTLLYTVVLKFAHRQLAR
jgi:hypothetical protein